MSEHEKPSPPKPEISPAQQDQISYEEYMAKVKEMFPREHRIVLLTLENEVLRRKVADA